MSLKLKLCMGLVLASQAISAAQAGVRDGGGGDMVCPQEGTSGYCRTVDLLEMGVRPGSANNSMYAKGPSNGNFAIEGLAQYSPFSRMPFDNVSSFNSDDAMEEYFYPQFNNSEANRTFFKALLE